MHVKGTSGKILQGNKEHVIGYQREDDPCYKVVKNLAELGSTVGWKRG